MRRLLAMPELNLAKIVTTNSRPPRPGEIDGNDYHFVTRDEFERKIAADEFLEWAHVHNDYKGNTRAAFDAVPAGKNILIQLELLGFETYRSKLGDICSISGIFLMPPSIDVIRQRIIARGDLYDLERRLADAEIEIAYADRYDHVIVNDDLESCVCAVANIIRG